MNVLITGASGFLGSALLARLLADGYDVAGATRMPIRERWQVASPDLGPHADWRPLLGGRQVVVHAAARAHVLRETAPDPVEAFRTVNTAGTTTLARQAAESGVRRFVFLSSIGVNGNRSHRPFTESDGPDPQEAYAVSKLEAENGLLEVARDTGMEIVILRPVLVYGAGAPGNIGRLVAAVLGGMPLPLGVATRNRRTLLALDNLADLTATCVVHPAAAGQVFLAGDSEDLSTAELLRKIALAFEVPLRLLPIPIWMLKAGGAVLGKRSAVRSLCDSLQVDISKARDLLGWGPPIGVDEGLRRMAQRWPKDETS